MNQKVVALGERPLTESTLQGLAGRPDLPPGDDPGLRVQGVNSKHDCLGGALVMPVTNYYWRLAVDDD